VVERRKERLEGLCLRPAGYISWTCCGQFAFVCVLRSPKSTIDEAGIGPRNLVRHSFRFNLEIQILASSLLAKRTPPVLRLHALISRKRGNDVVAARNDREASDESRPQRNKLGKLFSFDASETRRPYQLERHATLAFNFQPRSFIRQRDAM
jgi:hypothetical protein